MNIMKKNAFCFTVFLVFCALVLISCDKTADAAVIIGTWKTTQTEKNFDLGGFGKKGRGTVRAEYSITFNKGGIFADKTVFFDDPTDEVLLVLEAAGIYTIDEKARKITLLHGTQEYGGNTLSYAFKKKNKVLKIESFLFEKQ